MTPPDPIDEYVRDHLDREAARVDPYRVLAGVKGRVAAVPARRAWFRVVAGIGVGAAVAAGVGGLFFFGQTPPVVETRAATAEELVREAQVVHARPTDRCYDVTVEWEPAPDGRTQVKPPGRKSRLWTRGDQFWIESAAEDARTAWGQDAKGRIWVALSRKRGLVYDASELGEPITKYCNLMSLRIVSTLAEVLEQFEMLRKDGSRPGEPIRIEAKIRPNFRSRNPRFREIALTLDPDTKVVRQAVLKRQPNEDAVAVLSFSLTDTTPQPDDRYELRGHLDPDAEVLDKKDGPRFDRRARFRDEFLKRMQSRFR